MPVDVADRLLKFATHDDGAVRDLNLTDVAWAALPNLMDELNAEFELVQSHVDGNPVLDQGWNSVFKQLEREKRSLMALYASRGRLVRELQLFVCHGEDSPTFIELTFSPRDVVPGTTGTELLEWFQRLKSASAASEFFFRYENAAWDERDVGPSSGVIAASDWVADWEEAT